MDLILILQNYSQNIKISLYNALVTLLKHNPSRIYNLIYIKIYMIQYPLHVNRS